MTTDNTVPTVEEMNKVIAEFMDYLPPNHEPVKITVRREDGTEYESELPFCYHDSWNWLMPVVEKINKLFEEMGKKVMRDEWDDGEDKNLDDPTGWRAWSYRIVKLATDIKYVHQKVYESIIWYNQTQSPK